MSHWPFLLSAIQVVGDFRIGDFDLQSPDLGVAPYSTTPRLVVPGCDCELGRIQLQFHSKSKSL